MAKTYKGYELIKAIEKEELIEGTKFIDKYCNEYILKINKDWDILEFIKVEKEGEYRPDYSMLVNNEFEIIEEQQDIDIQNLHDINIDEVMTLDNDKRIITALANINVLIQAAKQTDRNIKDKE